MFQEYDTIVVGLGAAGTVAASTLARAGKKVLVLEGLDRLGGRVHTQTYGDGIVEIGAEWIQGTEDSRTYRTAIENNITILPQNIDIKVMQSDGTLASNAIHEIIDKAWEIAEEGDRPDKPLPLGDFISKKVMEYMKEHTPDVLKEPDVVTQIMRSLNHMLAYYESATDWNDINAAGTEVALEGNQHLSWGRNGYQTFFDIMLNKYKDGPGLPSLTIKLKTNVINIKWPRDSAEKVSVTTMEGAVYKADTVIVTVTLGVLKERHETLFSPSLPQEKITAIEKIQYGKLDKIIFSFPNAWWPSTNNIHYFLWKSDDINKVADEDKWITKVLGCSLPMGSSNTLTLWIGGDTAKEVEALPESVVQTKAMGLLRKFFGADVTIPEPTGMIRTKWFTNRFARGSYSYDGMSAADYPTARDDLAKPLTDSTGRPRVLFAGEATHTTRYGTVHGAADTGYREAMRLL